MVKQKIEKYIQGSGRQGEDLEEIVGLQRDTKLIASSWLNYIKLCEKITTWVKIFSLKLMLVEVCKQPTI